MITSFPRIKDATFSLDASLHIGLDDGEISVHFETQGGGYYTRIGSDGPDGKVSLDPAELLLIAEWAAKVCIYLDASVNQQANGV